MTKLSDAQALILGAAAQREDRNVLPLPGSLRGGAAAKVVGALLSRALIAETTTDSETKADTALNRIWRNDEDGRAILLRITDAGLAAIGIEPEGDSAPVGADEAPSAEAPKEAPPETKAAPKARKLREGTKQAQLIAMLRARGRDHRRDRRRHRVAAPLCRCRDYADVGSQAVVSGGDRCEGVDIIRGLRGRRGACRSAGSGRVSSWLGPSFRGRVP